MRSNGSGLQPVRPGRCVTPGTGIFKMLIPLFGIQQKKFTQQANFFGFPAILLSRPPESETMSSKAKTLPYLLNLVCLLLVTRVSAGDDIIFINGFDPCDPKFSCCQGTVLFSEAFAQSPASTWGGQWQTPGFEVEVEEVVNGQGRLVPVSSGYSLARLGHPLAVVNAEASFTLYFEDATSQGIGFYLRANGGYLQQTMPAGAGYAVFIEKFRQDNGQPQPGLGLWYEHNGIESPLLIDFDQAYELLDETAYQVRFQVLQLNPAETRLRARLWPAGAPEPDTWPVSVVDDYAPLQATAGQLAVDSWSTTQQGTINVGTRVDDLVIRQLCPPSASPE
jgi:hypothetical protein